MKLGSLYTSLLFALGASAQLEVSFLAPTANTRIAAGTPFTVTLGFPVTTSSQDVIALFFGAKNAIAGGIDDIGQTNLTVVFEPKFSKLDNGKRVQDFVLTFPKTLINGLDLTYNLTVGEFYTLGADRTPLIHTAQVPVFVSSA